MEMTRVQITELCPPQTPAHRQRLKRLIYLLASRFAISPKNTLEGVAICRELDRHGIASTLGKFSKSGDDPREIVREYCLASDSLRSMSTGGSFYLSLKPPSLGFQPEHARAIAGTALSNDHRIHFDSHGHDLVQPTLSLLERVIAQRLPSDEVPPGRHFSVTLPSRWKRNMINA